MSSARSPVMDWESGHAELLKRLDAALENMNYALAAYRQVPSDPQLKQALDRAANAVRNALKHARGE